MTKSNVPAASTNTNTGVAKVQKTNSERFTEKVMSEFKGAAGAVALSDYQKRLVQSYFIQIDQSLRLAEEKRLAKSEQYREVTSYEWKNIHMESLAVRVVACARIGWDPTQPNHVNPIPYLNKHLGKYEITFIPGYRGLELKSSKYGLDIPAAVVVELVRKKDKFQPIKKDKDNPVENYTFQITDPFDRGEIVGGFYYMEYADGKKNRLKFFTLADLEKRKPKHASAEFWGGEKDKWVKGKKEGTETIDGWREEMLYKTVFRAAWNSITIDPQKIDDAFVALLQSEQEMTASISQGEINEHANKGDEVGFSDYQEVNGGNLSPAEEPAHVEPEIAEPATVSANGQMTAPFA